MTMKYRHKYSWYTKTTIPHKLKKSANQRLADLVKLMMMMTRWLPWVKESEEVQGSKRQGGAAREGDERRDLAESGFAVEERSRLRISGRPKGVKSINKRFHL